MLLSKLPYVLGMSDEGSQLYCVNVPSSVNEVSAADVTWIPNPFNPPRVDVVVVQFVIVTLPVDRHMLPKAPPSIVQ